MTKAPINQASQRLLHEVNDHAAHVWSEFERAAIPAIRAGVVEMRLSPQDFMQLKWAIPRARLPDMRGRRPNGDILLFARLWVGEAK